MKAGSQAARRSDSTAPSLNVAQLHSTLGVYGAERWTLALAKHLDPRKIRTTILTIGTKPGADTFHHVAVSRGLSAFHVSVPGKLSSAAIRTLRRLLVDQRIDVLHTHGFKADVLGYLATRGLPIRLVSTIHGWSADEGFRIRAYETIGRTFLRRFDRIYPLSPGLLQDLERRRFDPRRLRLILNAVDLSTIEYGFRARGVADPFSILFVGRVCRPKGIFDLLEAFARARFNCPAELVVAGDGPDRTEAEALALTLGISDRVRFVGAVDDIGPILKGGDILVLPSYAEGIPRTLMEAFAAGVPVVGTAIPGIGQLVDDGETGLLVPVGDPTSLARALERLCANPDEAAKIAARARDRVLTRHDASRMATDYEGEYQKLCLAT